MTKINAHAILDRASLLAHHIYAEEIENDKRLLVLAKNLVDQAIIDEDYVEGQKAWQHLFKQSWNKIKQRMLFDNPEGRLLRSSSPFSIIIGIRNEDERRRLWRQAKSKIARENIITAIPNHDQMVEIILEAFPPDGHRPTFDIPRFWSNPSLVDPKRIISLVLATPTTEDLVRTIQAYGAAEVTQGLAEMIATRTFDDERSENTVRIYAAVLEGMAEAARQLRNSEIERRKATSS